MSLKSINESFERQFNAINDSKNEEFEILESLRNLLSTLNEAGMSDEDRRESDLIRSAYAKIQKRANARLTPEEQAVLDKYGIERRNWSKTLNTQSPTDGVYYIDDNKLIGNREDEYSHGREIGRTYYPTKPDGRKDYSRGYTISTKDPSKINYADRARKRPQRSANRTFDTIEYVRGWNDDDGWARPDRRIVDYNAGAGSDDSSYPRRRGTSQNTAVSAQMQSRMNQMRGALAQRKKAQSELDTAQAEFDRKKAEHDDRYFKAMQAAEDEYDRRMKYAKSEFDRKSDPTARNKAQSDIDTLLRRKKTEAIDLSDKEGSITNALSNDTSWKSAETPKELAAKVKEILDRKSIDTKASRSLIDRLSKKKTLADALFTIWNSILAGSGNARIK